VTEKINGIEWLKFAAKVSPILTVILQSKGIGDTCTNKLSQKVSPIVLAAIPIVRY